MNSSKRVLVTGAEGYLGSVLCPHLLDKGYDVTGLDTGFFRDSVFYEAPEYRVIKKDARDFSESDIKNIDAVIHLAGISNDPFGNLSAEQIYNPTRDYARRIAALCKKNGVRFIFASSCSVYGKSSGGVLTEESETSPQTAYSKNKLEVEEDLKKLAGGGFSPVALRLSTVFGASPRMRFDIVVNMFAGMAMTSGEIVLNSDGSAFRPNIDIRDVAVAFEAALESKYDGEELLVLNVGRDDNNLSVREIAEIVAREVGGVEIKFLQKNPKLDKEGLFKSKVVQDGVDTRTYKVSFDKIKKIFPGFACHYTVAFGARDLAETLRSFNLDETIFKNPNFYRLQKIEGLLKEGKINVDLRWVQ
ncbi:MAG: SDR family oxidoreductase [bacterium]|nr:SDR family oxidoreductase [bacterium]